MDPKDRVPHKEPRNAPLFTVITIVVITVGFGGFFYWYAFPQKSNYSDIYHQLGITQIPSTLELQPAVRTLLDQLSHEPCYHDAVAGLADVLLEAGYPRDTDTALINFTQRCGESDELLYRRYNALYQASDFPAAVRIADTLVGSNPADPQVRYWRGNAYEKLKDYSRALADYINSIQLLGEPDRVAIDNFYDVSRMYAALNRYCDAITPIETFISFDPASRRTTQSTKLIAEYAEKGSCDARYSNGSARVSRLAFPGMTGLNTLVVVVNGVPGNFLLDTGATYVAVTPDFASYRLAAAQGDVEAQDYLGLMYEFGRGVPKDYDEAVKWYRLAATQGNALGQTNLGAMFRNGRGVPQDDKEAVKWYRLAANQGFATAQFLLGMMYLRGNGLAQDYKEALRLLLIAAKKGNQGAQNDLGMMYRDGIGVARDYKEAMKWYRLAAEKNYAAALYNISSMYAEGLGVTQDFARAYMWVSLAAAQNLPDAMNYRDTISKRMTAQQIAETQAMARKCQESNYKQCD
jgi:TPR repeat protein